MKESESESADLSKVVSKIMEHPELIEQISGLLSDEKVGENAPTEPAVKIQAQPISENPDGKRRQKLLGALRPYLSKERARLLDSMSAVLDLMEAMGRNSDVLP